MSAVSAEPPNGRRSSGRTTWRSAPSAAAIRRGGLELDPVALAVIDGEREQVEAGLAGERGGDHRIEAARDEGDGPGSGGGHGGGG